jgi:hypothetical protein
MFRNVLFTNRGTIAAASIDRLIQMMAEIATDVTCYFVIPTELKRRSLATWSEPRSGEHKLPDRLQANEWISKITEAAAAARVRCKAYCVTSDSPDVFAAAERYGCDAIAIASSEKDDITLLNLQI